MSNFLIAVVDNNYSEDLLISTLKDRKEVKSLMSLGHGTAPTTLLALFGLGSAEKRIFWFELDEKEDESELLKSIGKKIKGRGIAFTLEGHAQSQSENGENIMESQFSLIVAITDKGYTEDVMEVARQAGARGGTALNARGVGMPPSETFFGIKLQEEKEMILIISKAEQAQKIMAAISGVKGTYPQSRTVVFCIPVKDAAGFSF